MRTVKFIDFSGQDIYVGLDVHKKNWSVSVIYNGREHKTFSQPPQPEILFNYLKRNFPNGTYHCVYEAGFSGFWIQRSLTELGIVCQIVHPADVPTSDKEKRRKTDPVDSRKLARGLFTGELGGIFIPSRIAEEERNLVRGRHYLVRDITRIKNRIKQVLSRYGIFSEEINENWSRKYVSWLESIELQTTAGSSHLQLLVGQFNELTARLKLINRRILELSKEDIYLHPIKCLRTIPGIGIVTAMTLATEIIDINRFPSLDALCSFVGLVPNTSSSGEKERIGRMTSRGNSFLRHVIIEAAWRAMKLDPALALAYKNYTARMKGNKAIIRIARKLLSRIRYVLRNQKEYQLLVA